MLHELIEVIGGDATARLIQTHGGRGLSIPSRHGRGCAELIEAIGEDAALRLCQHFAGESIYIPSAARFKTEAARQRARSMREAGASWREIARAIGYTERGARKLLDKDGLRLAEMPLDWLG